MNTRKKNTLVFNKALSYYDVAEIKGIHHNKEVLSLYKDASGVNVQDDETPWCAAFVGAVLFRCGLENTRKLNARSYQTYGIKTDKPVVGDIVVLWRESPRSWKGHVGFYIKHDERYVWMLGGNQGNKVCIAKYDINRVLSFRKYG